MTRRRFLKAAGVLGALGGMGALIGRGLLFRPQEPRTASPFGHRGPLDDYVIAITNGGPPKDGIPPIDRPRFVTADQADFLRDRDVVFGLVGEDGPRAYPQLILVWHEIVNDMFPDGPVSVTYCPLTGSAVGFRGAAPNGEPYTFGTSGDLVNSNLLMYDRQTDSRWPQILAQAILGPSRPRRLEEIPLDWTTWGMWRALHPDTIVLSADTGYIRTYGTDPYGSYGPPVRGYYAEGTPRSFPVMHEDDRFEAKEVFIGAKLGRTQLAVRKELLRSQGPVNTAIGGTPVTFLHDPGVDEGRAFRARADGQDLRFFRADEPGRYVDETTRTLWDPVGVATEGPLAGDRLFRVLSYDVMWFAWLAFFPETAVIG